MNDLRHACLISFSQDNDALQWQPIGDPVMGGRSEGRVAIKAGQGCFSGTVRPDNGGGFASAKTDLPKPLDASDYTGIEFLSQGDGKTYKVGLRNTTDRRRPVYQHSFTPPPGEWSRIRLPFAGFVPTWRGKVLTDSEPLDTSRLASVSLFISGGQFGSFELRMADWLFF